MRNHKITMSCIHYKVCLLIDAVFGDFIPETIKHETKGPSL